MSKPKVLGVESNNRVWLVGGKLYREWLFETSICKPHPFLGPFWDADKDYRGQPFLDKGAIPSRTDDFLVCKCGNNKLLINQGGDYSTVARCSKCGAEEEIHNG